MRTYWLITYKCYSMSEPKEVTTCSMRSPIEFVASYCARNKVDTVPALIFAMEISQEEYDRWNEELQ